MNNKLLLWCIVCLPFAQSCYNTKPSANPATEKCVQDGYAQELLLSSKGTPIQALCVNKEQKCEEWAYFIGNCKLDVVKDIVPSSKTTLANPATVKCLQDGYTWEPIMSSLGVPSGGVCVDKITNSKCEEWSYFRSECYFNKIPVVTSPPKLAN